MNTVSQQDIIYPYIGQRIRERRKLLKLNQSELAELMGFSYQQMQKYETGVSHVTAGKLLLFAKILNVPPSYFYDGLTLEEAGFRRADAHVISRDRLRPFRILLVEDNPADVLLFQKALEASSERPELLVMNNGETVMDYLQGHEVRLGQKLPDLIVLDLSLPKMSGNEILRIIKKHQKFVDRSVIVLTNSINSKDMTDCYRNGAAGFIQKSVDFEEYVDTVASMMRYWSKTVALPAA